MGDIFFLCEGIWGDWSGRRERGRVGGWMGMFYEEERVVFEDERILILDWIGLDFWIFDFLNSWEGGG